MGHPLTTLTCSDRRQEQGPSLSLKTRTESITLSLIFTFTPSDRHRGRPRLIILTIRENCSIYTIVLVLYLLRQHHCFFLPWKINRSQGCGPPGRYHKKFSPGYVLSHSFQMKKWKPRGFPGRVVVHHQFEPHIRCRKFCLGWVYFSLGWDFSPLSFLKKGQCLKFWLGGLNSAWSGMIFACGFLKEKVDT